ncbi:hypothetical protein BGZ72_010832 [Mortierella alpina]|nr:hypothetical protein BGZ72_010832 [Mortierella alpina]
MTQDSIEEPPGTGYRGRLTLAQKIRLKQMWKGLCEFTEVDVVTTIKKNRLYTCKIVPHARESTAETTEAGAQERGITGMEMREVLFDTMIGGQHDVLLLRFLRTNGWDIERAQIVLYKALRWRVEFGVSELTRLSEDELDRKYKGFKRQLELCKVRIHGRDKMGRLIVYFICKLHKSKDQPRLTMEKFIVYMLEYARLLTHPLDEVCVVFDLRRSGLGSMDISWTNPKLVSRIHFARHESDLLKYIDADHLLDSFGGKVKCKATDYVGAVAGEDDPMEDDAARDRLKQEWRSHLWKLEALLREWVGCQESETKATRAEQVIEAELEQAARDIRAVCLRMRPFFRARTITQYLRHTAPFLPYIMAKSAQGTPPGTGFVGCLTREQKKCLNAVWAAMLMAMATEVSDTPTPKKPTRSRTHRSRSLASSASSISEKTVIPEQKIKLQAKFAVEGGLYGEALREMLHINILGDNPAKEWDVEGAVRMLLRSLRWRLDYNVAELARENEDELDKNYLTARLHKFSAQPRETMEKFVVQTLESGRLLIHPNEEACIIFDMIDFGFIGQVDMKILKFTINLLQYHYPGCVGRFIILDSPRPTQTLWRVISPWLAESFASKVRFACHSRDLLKYIDAEHLPTCYEGGKAQWKYEYIAPVPRLDIRRKDTANKERMEHAWKALMWKFEALIRERIDCEETETPYTRAEAVIEAELERLVSNLRVAYFRMRPYICARNLYERSNDPPLREDGSVVWTY